MENLGNPLIDYIPGNNRAHRKLNQKDAMNALLGGDDEEDGPPKIKKEEQVHFVDKFAFDMYDNEDKEEEIVNVLLTRRMSNKPKMPENTYGRGAQISPRIATYSGKASAIFHSATGKLTSIRGSKERRSRSSEAAERRSESNVGSGKMSRESNGGRKARSAVFN